MSTRSVIFITGHTFTDQHRLKTVRLYKHTDGYPSNVLHHIADGTRMARRMIGAHDERFNPEELGRPTPFAIDLLACAIMASTIDIYSGFAAMIDHDEERGRPAIYESALTPFAYGNQGDLDWVYVLDIPEHSLKIYGRGDGSVEGMIPAGLTDPYEYLRNVREEFKDREREAIRNAIGEVQVAGWIMNPSGQPQTPSTAVVADEPITPLPKREPHSRPHNMRAWIKIAVDNIQAKKDCTTEAALQEVLDRISSKRYPNLDRARALSAIAQILNIQAGLAEY